MFSDAEYAQNTPIFGEYAEYAQNTRRIRIAYSLKCLKTHLKQVKTAFSFFRIRRIRLFAGLRGKDFLLNGKTNRTRAIFSKRFYGETKNHRIPRILSVFSLYIALYYTVYSKCSLSVFQVNGTNYFLQKIFTVLTGSSTNSLPVERERPPVCMLAASAGGPTLSFPHYSEVR